MTSANVYYVGTDTEVAHHAQPLQAKMPVQIITPEQIASIANVGDVAIFFSEHFDRFRNAVFELKQKGVATIYQIDGILEWRNAWENRIDEPACPWTMRPVLCDIAACIGNAQKRILNSWGNAEKTIVTGLPRLTGLIEGHLKNDAEVSIEDNLKILITTAKWPGFTNEQMDNARRVLSDLKSYFDETKTISGRNVEVTWRLTQHLADEIKVKNCLSSIQGTEIQEVIGNHHVVLTTPSTVQLESMLMGRPTAIIDYNNCPHYVDAAWKIGTRENIGRVLESMAQPTNERIDYQRWLLHENLDIRPNPEERLIDLVNQAHSLSLAKVKINNQSIQNIEPTTGLDQIQALNLQTQYGKHHDFREFDVIELQAQLAHSRREIDLRQARIDQLESELAEAHRIFEQIEHHPIAGPVVKLRRGFKSLISSITGNNDRQNTDAS